MKLFTTTLALALLGQTSTAYAESYDNTYIQFYNDSAEPLQFTINTTTSTCSILRADMGSDTASTTITVQPGTQSPLVDILEITNWSNNLCFNGIVLYSVDVNFQNHAPISCRLSNTKVLSNGEDGGYQADPTGGCPTTTNPSFIINSAYSKSEGGYVTTFRVGLFTYPPIQKSLVKNNRGNKMMPHSHPMTEHLMNHSHPLKEIEHYNTSKVNPMTRDHHIMNHKPMIEKR